MDIDILYTNIKEYCAQMGISITQLEKELHFGTGTIGKWKQSFPSIEKVVAVAEFFHVSTDKLCGLTKGREEVKSKFMEGLIKKTLESEITWYPCSYHDFIDIRFCPSFLYSEVDEIYGADYDAGSLYIVHRKNELNFYILLENYSCMKQDENFLQLQELWEILKNKEQEMLEKIDEYKRIFMSE